MLPGLASFADQVTQSTVALLEFSDSLGHQINRINGIITNGQRGGNPAFEMGATGAAAGVVRSRAPESKLKPLTYNQKKAITQHNNTTININATGTNPKEVMNLFKKEFAKTQRRVLADG